MVDLPRKNNGENHQAQNQQVQEKGPCFVCGKNGHIALFCRFWKRGGKRYRRTFCGGDYRHKHG